MKRYQRSSDLRRESRTCLVLVEMNSNLRSTPTGKVLVRLLKMKLNQKMKRKLLISSSSRLSMAIAVLERIAGPSSRSLLWETKTSWLTRMVT